MKIGLYNEYWNTFGGGERHAGSIAEVLKEQHEVELIATEPVDIPLLSSRLNMDLDGVGFRQWPHGSTFKHSYLTRDYDLFINSTYWSGLESNAKYSLYLCFFPHELWPEWLSNVVSGNVRYMRWLVGGRILPVSGYYMPEPTGHLWLEPVAQLLVHPLAIKSGMVKIPLFDNLNQNVYKVLGPGRGSLDFQIQGNELLVALPFPCDKPVKVEIHSEPFSPQQEQRNNDMRKLGICLSAPRMHGRGGRGSLNRFMSKVDRYTLNRSRKFINSYDTIIANSEYTRSWIRERWGRPSVILTPPIDTEVFRTAGGEEKKRIILSVGRFFAGGHNKKHLEMLRVFRKMYDNDLVPPGWEYHMVGAVHLENREHIEYFSEVRRMAEGYPIRIMADLPFEQLREEYREASIFWHAAGWGENEKRNPERFEHFGITTCEAMAAGCVPVVVAKAGQLEIVDGLTNGYLFHDEDELIKNTIKLFSMYEDGSISKLSLAAVKFVKRYDKEAFRKRLLSIIDNLGCV